MTESFAYLLLHCNLAEHVVDEILPYGASDFLEVALCCDDNPEGNEGIIPFDLSNHMGRICLLQITRGWNPQSTIQRLIESGELIVAARGKKKSKHKIIFFELPETTQFSAQDFNPAIATAPDETRFFEILTRTAEIAQTINRGILFIGCEGFTGQPECTTDVNVLNEYGMEFFTHYSPIEND